MENLNIEVVKQFIESNKESEDVKGFLNGFKTVEKEELTIDSVKNYLNTNPDGQKFYDTSKSEHLNTWISNNFEKKFNEEAVKRGYELDESAKKYKELQDRVDAAERKAIMAEIKVSAKNTAKEKNLPFELVDYFLGEDEEVTNKNLATLETVWAEALKRAVEEKLASGSRPPVITDKNNPDAMTVEEFRKLGYKERVKFKEENPSLYEKLIRG